MSKILQASLYGLKMLRQRDAGGMLIRQLSAKKHLRGWKFRCFHICSNLKINKSQIPSVILQELQDVSKLSQEPKMKEETKNILILDPKSTTDKKYSSLVDELSSQNFKQPFDLGAVERFQKDLEGSKNDEESYETMIEKFKPVAMEVTQRRFESIKDRLKASFTRIQLLNYIRANNKHAGSRESKGFSKVNKSKLSEAIIKETWGIKVTDKLTTIDDLYVSRSIKLNRCDLFLLLSENGFIIQYISRTGVKISYDSKKSSIELTGMESQVNNAEININSILSRTHKERIDLSLIKKMFNEKFSGFQLDLVGRNTEVFFNHIGDDVYDLVSLNANQIKRSKRLLLWLLNYNKHSKETLYLMDDVQFDEFFPFKDDDSLAWINRKRELYVWNKKLQRKCDSLTLENDLEKYSDSSLSVHDGQFEEVIEKSKSLPNSYTNSTRNEEHSKLLGELGLVDSESFDKSAGNNSVEIISNFEERSSHQVPYTLPMHEKDKIYRELKDFNYREKLFGVSSDQLNDPIFTVTLADILYDKDYLHSLKSRDSTTTSIKGSDAKFCFTSNLQSANDRALSLSLYDYPNLTSRNFNQFTVKDPHNYVVQLRFLPSLYQDDSIDNIEEQINYPPVEMWIDLNETSIPDLETMNVVTVEGENNAFIPLPGMSSDLKVCCQLSGNLLKSDEISVPEVEKPSSTIDEILSATTSRYLKFDSQPGIEEFLVKSKLDFSGRVATSIHPYIDLIVGGKKVRYHYINVSYRRSLDLCYKGQGEERLVQLNIVEGGSLGGRKLELNLIGELSNTLDKDAFDRLIDDSIEFANEL